MTKNPFLNAGAAIAYIAFIASFIFYGSKIAKPEDTVLGPILFLSLFTLSAAVMAYVFFFTPFEFYFAGKKKEAVKLAFQTLGVFAGFTFILLLVVFSGII
jgi:hypothetical protein